MHRFSLVILLLGFSVVHVFAQGSIAGQVKDAATGEPVIGASVLVQGTQTGASTDVDGKFLIASVAAGTYNLQISYITYKTHIVENVKVEDGKRVTIDIQLTEDVSELSEVVVQGIRSIDNDFALLAAIRESRLVISGISAEQIVRVPDRDAAQIMRRVPGVSIVDNRFVMIRGVSERYNQVMINHAIGPSTEVDKRSFSFDLIPSSSIDQILILKSGSADMPGDFAGGVIRVITKQATDENYLKVGLNFGYRVNTTFRDFRQSQGSSTDIFGFDNGFRQLPSSFPSTSDMINSSRTSLLREQAGRMLPNNFDYNTRSAPMDMGGNLEWTRNFRIGQVRISTLNNLTYSNSYLFRDVEFNRYLIDELDVETRFAFRDKYYENDVRISGISNWGIQINDRHSLEFKNLFNVLGEHRTIIRDGQDLFVNADRIYRNYSYQYLSRRIYSGQLQGTHRFAENTMTLEWVAGYNFLDRNEPDYRRFRTFRVISSGEETYQMQLPPSANLFETGRFYSDLSDRGVLHGLNLEKKFGKTSDNRSFTVKSGYYIESKARDFSARYVSYLYPGFFDPQVGEQLIRLPLSNIFSPENIRSQDGFVIEEGTRPSDTYRGENLLLAGYVAGSLPLGKFDINAGLRVEHNVQQLKTANVNGPVYVNNPITSPMPFLNAAYNITDKSLVRLAYSRTINRPEFRELAPFLYYNFELELGVFGNPNLKTANIHNIDLRWEKYPRRGEFISAGLFYKSFANAIETILQLTTEAPQATYGNADKAVAYGTEIEVKKSLSGLGASRFISNLSVNLNASYIFSEVDLGQQAGFQQRKRQIQGQSPYLFNTGLFYTDHDAGFSVSVAYNIFGQRIFQVGDINFPSIYELPRHSLDMQISKRFGGTEFKLNIQNLLNAEYRFYQDTDVNNKIITSSSDAPILRYRTGQQFSASIVHRIGR